MIWLVDTSAWARRAQPAVAAELKAILNQGDELALSPPVLLELLRRPQGKAVAAEKQALLSLMTVPAMGPETTEIAAQLMASLALHSPTAHRVPVTDLLTAALAHQLEAGVVHADHDFEQIAKYGGIDLPTRRCKTEEAELANRTAARQRELKKEFSQLLHQMPIERAEATLERILDDLRGDLIDNTDLG